MAYPAMKYEYETSPKKLKPEYEKRQDKNKKVSTSKNKKTEKNQHTQLHAKTIAYIVIGFAILFAISYRNSLITESFNKKENLKDQLSALQKENAQLEINIQTSLNLANIEKSASSMLGMQKLAESQKVYVSLPKKDYVELASEQVIVTEEKSWIQKLLDGILNLTK